MTIAAHYRSLLPSSSAVCVDHGERLGTENCQRRLIKQRFERGNQAEMKRMILYLFVTALLSACTWVQPEPGTQAITLLDPPDALECRRLGQTTVSVRDRVAGVQRSPSQIAEELATLARNSAVDLGGNAIVEEEIIDPGKQRFGIYRCDRN